MRLDRRSAIASAGLFALGVGAPAAPAGRLRHSVCRWCHGKVPLDELAHECKAMGYESIELLSPRDVPIAQAAGLTCAVLQTGGPVTIGQGLNQTKNHPAILKSLREGIDFAAAHRVPNVICFSGNRAGRDDAEGLKTCAEGLKQIVGHAEQQGVTIVMELLNSKVDHKDYMADRTAWGAELVATVSSARFKLLYDIYHMQIMEGDVIRTIEKHKAAIGHYHTGGVPGRAEIDETQELNYPAICRAIARTGYDQFIGQEFIPRKDWKTSLSRARELCTV